MELPDEVDRWGRAQWGLVTFGQLCQVMSASTVHRLCRRGVLVEVAPHVYRLVGTPRSWRQRALAACLTVGPPVALSGLASGYLHRLEVVARPEPQLIVPPSRRPRWTGARIARSLLPPEDVYLRENIPATTPLRTLLDLSRTLDADGLQKVADELVRRGRLTAGDLRLRLDGQLPRCDLRSLQLVADRLDLRGVGDSARENWVVDTLVDAGLPAPERQVRIEIAGRVLILDCAYVGAKVAIEYDGWREHSGRRRFDGDRDRSFLLQMADWEDVRVTSAWSGRKLVDRVTAALLKSATGSPAA